MDNAEHHDHAAEAYAAGRALADKIEGTLAQGLWSVELSDLEAIAGHFFRGAHDRLRERRGDGK